MKRIFFFLMALIFFSISTFATLQFFSAKPPIGTLEQTHLQIGVAVDAEAEKYATELVQTARTLLEQAYTELKLQNERLFFLRDYQKTIRLASEASAKANEAIENTSEKRNSLHSSLKKALRETDNKINHFQTYYAHLPLNGNARKNFTSAKLKYVESKKAYERGAYLFVDKNLTEANHLISKSVTAAHQHLSEYFSDLKKWKRWYEETVDWTIKNKSTAIIVDKFAHKCYIYKNGKRQKEFVAELGPNWIGTKLYRGDKATPEGKYHVTKKKSGSQTKYYKALLINYPNDDDKSRYKSNIKNRNIPNRGIGNLIEIHGGGGKGINWTDGCVALSNEDMDKVFALAGSGTPITIVGSLLSLQEINGH